jgi:hypothetical protein
MRELYIKRGPTEDRFGSSTAALLTPPHGCSTVNTGHQGTTLSIRAPGANLNNAAQKSAL